LAEPADTKNENLRAALFGQSVSWWRHPFSNLAPNFHGETRMHPTIRAQL